MKEDPRPLGEVSKALFAWTFLCVLCAALNGIEYGWREPPEPRLFLILCFIALVGARILALE